MRAPVSQTAAVAAMVVGVVVVVLVGGAAMAARGGVVTDRPGKWFSWREFERSTTAASRNISNAIPTAARDRIRDLVRAALDPLREALGRPVYVTSGYRSPELNRAIGGSPTSQHQTGEAADIRVDGLTSAQLARRIIDLGIPYDQLVWYVDSPHVHISYRRGRLRREVLRHHAGAYAAVEPPRGTVA